MTQGVILNVGKGQSAPIKEETIMGRKLTVEDVTNRVKETFPKWEFEVLEYDTAMKPMKIKCLQCGEIKTYKQLYHLLNKQTPCICTSNSSQYKSIQQIQELDNFFNESNDFDLVEWTTTNDAKHKPAAIIYHKGCNKTFIRRTCVFYKDRTCPYCGFSAGNKNNEDVPYERSIKKKPAEKVLERIANSDYELLEEYQGSQIPVLLRHNKCGFIRKVKLHDLNQVLNSCPNCNKAISKGERKIMEYLTNKNIEFKREYSFDWQSHKKYRYDFFIIKYNLIIEFNGQQHYEEIPFFKKSLQTNQEHDNIKMTEALNNGFNYLIIPYTHYNKIEEILDNWFNDYPKGVDNKLTVIERDTTLL